MPPVKGKGKKKSPAKGRKTSRGRKKQLTLIERVRQGLADLGAGIVSFMAVGLAALALIAVLMLLAGGYFWNVGERVETLSSRVAKTMGFSISRVSLHGGTHLTDRDVMLALENGEQGTVLGSSLLHLDAEGARRRIEKNGWVRAAAVQRLWPNTVHVSVIERRPIALWQARGGSYSLIDPAGNLIAEVSPTAYTDLPVIANVSDPQAALSILEPLAERPELMGRVAVILGVNDRRFDLRFRNDFTARLPEGAGGVVLDRLEGLGAGTGKLAENLDYIDLRDPEWAYLKPKTK